MARPRAVIASLAGLELTAEERWLFAGSRPAGFILFRRNCDNPEQLRALTADLHQVVPDWQPLILIDQEGGRVARLRPPHWPKLPPPAVLGRLAVVDLNAACEAAHLHARLIGQDLSEAGIDVVCAPLLDVATPQTTDAIGDRAYSVDPAIVSALGRAAIEGFRNAGVWPVIKHLPGHGRAAVDSHETLPRVEATLEQLQTTDFIPFTACRNVAFGMTAHIVLETVDPERPATQSPTVIGDIIRRQIGFEGVLFSDDISMRALRGDLVTRSQAALDAGCNLVLHCTGDVDEATTLLPRLPSVDERVGNRLLEAAQRQPAPPTTSRASPADLDRLLTRLT